MVHISLTVQGQRLADRALRRQAQNANQLLAHVREQDVQRLNRQLRQLLLETEKAEHDLPPREGHGLTD